MPPNSHKNQLRSIDFWPLKHGLQHHKRMEEEDTSFLKKLTRKRCLGVDQGAPIKRSQGGGALVHVDLEMDEERRENSSFYAHKIRRKEYVERELEP